jgi:hypothetical protein
MDQRDDDHALTGSPLGPEVGSGGRLILGWALLAVSAVMLVAGWYGVSGQPLVAAQLAYLASGGLGGLMTGIVGVGMLVSHDVRRDRERLGRVEAALLEIRQMLVAQREAGGDLPPFRIPEKITRK